MIFNNFELNDLKYSLVDCKSHIAKEFRFVYQRKGLKGSFMPYRLLPC